MHKCLKSHAESSKYKQQARAVVTDLKWECRRREEDTHVRQSLSSKLHSIFTSF